MEQISDRITVIGAGLAGCEAAWQAAQQGAKVLLIEMKPKKFTPAHHYPGFAELVCSNSLRSAQRSNAIGLLKEELRMLGSLIMEAADATAVPAGAALAVDRVRFSDYITKKIRSHPLIELREDEVTELPSEGITIVATGPLTADHLAQEIVRKVGSTALWFFDAAAPIVDAASIDMDQVYAASRYGKGDAAYLNCPMTREEYYAFHQALCEGRSAPTKEFEKDPKVFEGCMPVEVMAKRGPDTLMYGPLKPVGLPDPRTGREPFAVVQLRPENLEGNMYNLVGFQTHLAFEEQRRIFGMIPGLAHAEFLRYGVMHRNTFLQSPRLLSPDYSLRNEPRLFFAGQMTGVEGYIESTSSGWIAGIQAARRLRGLGALDFPPETVIGSLAHYISNPAVVHFQPMNANFGLVPPLPQRVRGGKIAKNEALADRSLGEIKQLLSLLH